MAQTKDYTGSVIGSKLVLGRTDETCNKHPKWRWRCIRCGNEGKPVTWSNLARSIGYVGCNNCKTPRLKQIPVGAQINNLVVTGPCERGKPHPSGGSRRLVPCRCVECGAEGLWEKGNILAGTANCKCRQYVQKGKSNTRVGVMWSAARKRAREQGLPFSITHEDIRIPERCPILGIELSTNEGWAGNDSPSLDKIIPELGYAPGNIAVISWRANRLKGDGTLEEIEAVAAWMRAQKRGPAEDGPVVRNIPDRD